MNTINYPFKNDHELFIALIEDFNHSVEDINKQLIGDRSDTMSIKQILEQQYAAIDKRLSTVEDNYRSLDPKVIAQDHSDVRELKQWKDDYDKTKHIAWVVASTLFGIIGYGANMLLNYLSHANH